MCKSSHEKPILIAYVVNSLKIAQGSFAEINILILNT